MAEAASIGELVVSGISHVAWPATVLTLGLVFRGGIKSGFEKLFSRSSLKEFKAGAAGISATFEAERQISAETSDLTNAARARNSVFPTTLRKCCCAFECIGSRRSIKD